MCFTSQPIHLQVCKYAYSVLQSKLCVYVFLCSAVMFGCQRACVCVVCVGVCVGVVWCVCVCVCVCVWGGFQSAAEEECSWESASGRSRMSSLPQSDGPSSRSRISSDSPSIVPGDCRHVCVTMAF